MAANAQGSSTDNINVQDPFRNWTKMRLKDMANKCIEESNLHDYKSYIINGAYLAQDPKAELELEGREHDSTRPRDVENEDVLKRLLQQPRRLYFHVFCCALGAFIQGMDESAVNGGQCAIGYVLQTRSLMKYSQLSCTTSMSFPARIRRRWKVLSMVLHISAVWCHACTWDVNGWNAGLWLAS